MLWLSLLMAAMTALLTACCYGELVSLFPDSGGGYEYIAQGLGRTFANFMSVVLFLTGVISPAAISLAFGEYLGRLIDIDVFWSATSIVAIGIIALLTWLFSLIGELGKVASMSNLCVLTLFLVVNVSLVALRRTQPDKRAKFRLPLNVANVSLISVAAIAMLLVMIAFSVLNVFS